MKMKWKMLLAAAAATVLMTVPAASVSAQTITLDTEGPEYTGDYLMTWNTQTKMDAFANEGTDKSLDESWEATGITGAGGVYADWYLFGRYLSAQTQGYTGGGDEIYKTVFNCVQDDYTNANTGELVKNVGKCDYDTLEKTLTDMGYLGTGTGAKAKDLNEMLRNFVLAAYFRQGSGVYSLGGYGKFDLSSFDTAVANTVTATPQKIPGGRFSIAVGLSGICMLQL